MDANTARAGDSEEVGAKVRRLRTERGISQDALSIRASVDQSGLSKFERGGRGMGAVPLRRVAAALGITFEELIQGTDFKSG